MQIVIAWKDTDHEFVRSVYVGKGAFRNEFKEISVGHAAMWLNEGTRKDVLKAREYIAKERPDGKVFIFHDEPDPLGKAKQRILAVTK